MSLAVNVTCKPFNINGVAPGDESFIYISSAWSKTNVTAMTQCCAPQKAREAGCFTWCLLPENIDEYSSEAVEDWKNTFQACLTEKGRLASGNTSYVAPTALVELDVISAAATRHLGFFGVRGAVVVTLGVLCCVLGG